MFWNIDKIFVLRYNNIGRDFSKIGEDMTEEIIRIIKDAEEQALLEKQEAAAQAEKILAEAQKECAQMEQATAAVCKAYKESG